MAIGDLLPGVLFAGKYKVLGRLGRRGAQAQVYAVFDTDLKRERALKVLHLELAQRAPAWVERLRHEAQVTASLEEFPVVRVYGIGSAALPGAEGPEPVLHFALLEKMAEGSAAEWIQRTWSHSPRSWADATRIVTGACRGLAAAHERGLVHLDVTPGNILLGDSLSSKLADFGLAGYVDPATGTLTGALPGTSDYASPEQWGGELVDYRSDVYALGATYYHLLTGEPPYAAVVGRQRRAAHEADPPPDPLPLVPGLPAACAAVVLRAMAKRPAERYRHAGELLEDLRAILAREGEDSTQAHRESLPDIPALPPHYLQRVEELEILKAKVLGAGERPIAVTAAARVGVHGMGGIGKSVLAAALAHDRSIQRAFPDGVFWVTIGEDATPISVVEEQKKILRKLLSLVPPFSGVLEGLGHLRAALKGRRCLLALDDVWKAEHAQWFLVTETACRLLLTTRDAGVLTALDAREHSLEVLTDGESLTLLRSWAGEQGELPSEAAVVARACGNLPFALALCGAMARDGIQWSTLRHALEDADLCNVSHDLISYGYRNVLACMQVSLKFLDQEHPGSEARYRELVVFPPNQAVPEVTVQTLWGEGGLKAHQTDILLTRLERKSLLKLHGAPPNRNVVLHDIQSCYLRAVVPDAGALHARLIHGYRRRSSRGWASVSDDGYLYDHLVRHLEASGATEELTYSVATEAWRNARVRQRGGRYDGYVNDLTTAWRCADGVARQAIDNGEPGVEFLTPLRYCLIRQTINSLAADYPPTLVALAVFRGLWSVERALDIVSQVRDLDLRTHMLWLSLVAAVQVSDEQRDRILGAAIEAISTEPKADVRAHRFGLLAIAPALTAAQKDRALKHAEESTLEMPFSARRAHSLHRLIELTDDQRVRRDRVRLAHTTAEQIVEPDQKALALIQLMEFVEGEARDGLHRDAEAACNAIREPTKRFEILRMLKPDTIAGQDLLAAKEPALESPADKASVALAYAERVALLGQLSAGLIDSALVHSAVQAACKLLESAHGRDPDSDVCQEAEKNGSEALQKLASHLDGELLQLALTQALAIRHRWHREGTLVKLLPRLPDDRLDEAVNMALGLDSENNTTFLGRSSDWEKFEGSFRARALVALVPRCRGDLLSRIVETTAGLRDDEDRCRLLIAALPLVPEPQREAIARLGIEGCHFIENPESSVECLRSLAPHLEGDTLEHAFDVVPTINEHPTGMWVNSSSSSGLYRDTALKALCDSAPLHTLLRALENCTEIGRFHEERDAIMSIRLQQCVDDPAELKSLVKDIFSWGKTRLLVDVVRRIGGSVPAITIHQMLLHAFRLEDQGERASLINALAPYLPDDQLNRTIDTVLELPTRYGMVDAVRPRAWALQGLAPRLTGNLWERARRAAINLPQAEDRVCLLCELLVGAPEGSWTIVLDEAVKSVAVVDAQYKRIKALKVLSAHATPDAFRRLYDVIGTLDNEIEKAECYAFFGRHLTPDQKERVLTVLLAPRTDEEGKRWGAGAESLQALAPHLPPMERRRAVLTLFRPPCRFDVGSTLREFALNRTEEELRWILDQVVARSDRNGAAAIICSLIPLLPEQLLGLAWDCLLRATEPRTRARVGRAFLSKPQWQGQALRIVRTAILDLLLDAQESPRSGGLAVCKEFFTTEVFSPLLLKEAIGTIREIVQEWPWSSSPLDYSTESSLSASDRIRRLLNDANAKFRDGLKLAAVPRVIDEAALESVLDVELLAEVVFTLRKQRLISWKPGIGWRMDAESRLWLLGCWQAGNHADLRETHAHFARHYTERLGRVAPGFRNTRYWQNLALEALYHHALAGGSPLGSAVAARLADAYWFRLDAYAVGLAETLRQAAQEVGDDEVRALSEQVSRCWAAHQAEAYEALLPLLLALSQSVEGVSPWHFGVYQRWQGVALVTMRENNAALLSLARGQELCPDPPGSQNTLAAFVKAKDWTDKYQILRANKDVFYLPEVETALENHRACALAQADGVHAATIAEASSLLRDCKREGSWRPFDRLIEEGRKPIAVSLEEHGITASGHNPA